MSIIFSLIAYQLAFQRLPRWFKPEHFHLAWWTEECHHHNGTDTRLYIRSSYTRCFEWVPVLFPSLLPYYILTYLCFTLLGSLRHLFIIPIIWKSVLEKKKEDDGQVTDGGERKSEQPKGRRPRKRAGNDERPWAALAMSVLVERECVYSDQRRLSLWVTSSCITETTNRKRNKTLSLRSNNCTNYICLGTMNFSGPMTFLEFPTLLALYKVDIKKAFK